MKKQVFKESLQSCCFGYDFDNMFVVKVLLVLDTLLMGTDSSWHAGPKRTLPTQILHLLPPALPTPPITIDIL